MAKTETTEHVVHPRENASLFGQEEVESRLLQAQQSGRLPHAWLLTGTRGIGKATLAFRFARFLLNGAGAGSAGGLFGDLPVTGFGLDPEDPIFRRIAGGAHPDLLVLERESDEKTGRLKKDIPVERVRETNVFLHRTAAEGGWRVVIVDSMDELNRNGANALLKILEEPPRKTLLLLISHLPGRLLPTIRSRCCQLPLKDLSRDDIENLLADQRPGLPQEDLSALARLADGSIGRALILADNEGLPLFRALLDIAARQGPERLQQIEELGNRMTGEQGAQLFRTLLDLLSWWLGRVVCARAGGVLGPEIYPGEQDLALALGARRSLAQWVALWEKFVGLSDKAEGLALDRKQVVTAALWDLDAAA
jgi:DNA polymerase-3 subunit delta'